MVSIRVHVFKVVFSSIPTNDFTNQKPESLKWEHTVAPLAMELLHGLKGQLLDVEQPNQQ